MMDLGSYDDIINDLQPLITYRCPIPGDKFALPHAQMVTFSYIISDNDLPPFIINKHVCTCRTPKTLQQTCIDCLSQNEIVVPNYLLPSYKCVFCKQSRSEDEQVVCSKYPSKCQKMSEESIRSVQKQKSVCRCEAIALLFENSGNVFNTTEILIIDDYMPPLEEDLID